MKESINQADEPDVEIEEVEMIEEVQYPALSHGRALPNQYTPHLHQPLNHQIQLGNFNIWASYSVVYDL